MTKIIEPNSILTTTELADIFDVSERTVRRMVERGELPRNKKKGNTYYWTGQQILNSVATVATSEPDKD